MLCPDELVTKEWNCCQQNLSSASWAFILHVPHSKRKVLWFVDFCFWWGPCCSSSLLCCVWFLFYRLRIVHFSICEGDYVHLNIDLYLFINFRYGFFFAHLFKKTFCHPNWWKHVNQYASARYHVDINCTFCLLILYYITKQSD
jgi:hypothetical protein